MTTPTPDDAPLFDPPVFCSGIERDCKHGQLARSCNICELERDLAAAQEARQRAEALAESFRKDAERYRWLRDGDNDKRILQPYHHGAWLPQGEKLDAAIDAAREPK